MKMDQEKTVKMKFIFSSSTKLNNFYSICDRPPTKEQKRTQKKPAVIYMLPIQNNPRSAPKAQYKTAGRTQYYFWFSLSWVFLLGQLK